MSSPRHLKLLHICVIFQKHVFFALNKVYQELYTLQWNKQAHKCAASFHGRDMILRCGPSRNEGVSWFVCLFLCFHSVWDHTEFCMRPHQTQYWTHISDWRKSMCELNSSVNVLVTWVILLISMFLDHLSHSELFSTPPHPWWHSTPLVLKVWSSGQQAQHHMGLIRNSNTGVQPQTCWIRNSQCDVQQFIYQTFQVILRATALDVADTNNSKRSVLSISNFLLSTHLFLSFQLPPSNISTSP